MADGLKKFIGAVGTGLRTFGGVEESFQKVQERRIERALEDKKTVRSLEDYDLLAISLRESVKEENQNALETALGAGRDIIEGGGGIENALSTINAITKAQRGAKPAEKLKQAKATEELGRRAAVKEPLDTRIPQPTKGGWFGIGATKVNDATTNFAKTVKTRQDLINMIRNVDALEVQGVSITQLEDLYESELLKLAAEGYLSEK